ncbi:MULTISPECIES: thioredoxin family protein [unclassified Oceanobacter]|uniref:thioredoxin family protein n=1 Tax=unclassified Oceanobacter TaxID=2620260 RepID=UPI0026E15FC0|nr:MULTISPECIES: thioredoxin family protein [unclassified Oceanobacter]MDO6683486.1 thioredoxin family protein [Oceanobacter sp. 5_MG-2023]MDP2505190.1 thioredoxin family protein [Oceanobacter sp. 3_MG-2023]MDP2548451.1 thioredoxin family protein [Oceanobacter sp. 4_MG-2023]MDP2610347.1 thioredoxin family protein [Oceanobacter sp. 1_MG-2023]MDP2613724.1 thioredoxin family protein [Oceanobacter sp. 2_MG-2023]
MSRSVNFLRSTTSRNNWLLMACLAFFSHWATAAEGLFEPFTQERFEALVEQQAPVLVDIHAVWCPTCKLQGEVLSAFQKEHAQCDLTILQVDFDDQKEWVRHFKAPRQSTFVLYTGGERSWFSVAETRQNVITDALKQRIGC